MFNINLEEAELEFKEIKDNVLDYSKDINIFESLEGVQTTLDIMVCKGASDSIMEGSLLLESKLLVNIINEAEEDDSDDGKTDAKEAGWFRKTLSAIAKVFKWIWKKISFQSYRRNAAAKKAEKKLNDEINAKKKGSKNTETKPTSKPKKEEPKGKEDDSDSEESVPEPTPKKEDTPKQEESAGPSVAELSAHKARVIEINKKCQEWSDKTKALMEQCIKEAEAAIKSKEDKLGGNKNKKKRDYWSGRFASINADCTKLREEMNHLESNTMLIFDHINSGDYKDGDKKGENVYKMKYEAYINSDKSVKEAYDKLKANPFLAEL